MRLRAIAEDEYEDLSDVDQFDDSNFREFIFDYVYEYWGKSGAANAVMETLQDLGEDIDYSSGYTEIDGAWARHPQEVEEALAPYMREIEHAFQNP
jgi:hypothetical protein